MSNLAISQSPLNASQILARLETLERGAARDVTNVMRPMNVPVGIAILASQTIQAVRTAEGWRKPPGVKLAEYNFAR